MCVLRRNEESGRGYLFNLSYEMSSFFFLLPLSFQLTPTAPSPSPSPTSSSLPSKLYRPYEIKRVVLLCCLFSSKIQTHLLQIPPLPLPDPLLFQKCLYSAFFIFPPFHPSIHPPNPIHFTLISPRSPQPTQTQPNPTNQSMKCRSPCLPLCLSVCLASLCFIFLYLPRYSRTTV